MLHCLLFFQKRPITKKNLELKKQKSKKSRKIIFEIYESKIGLKMGTENFKRLICHVCEQTIISPLKNCLHLEVFFLERAKEEGRRGRGGGRPLGGRDAGRNKHAEA